VSDETSNQAGAGGFEDLELLAEDADTVIGGDGEIARKAGKDKHEYLVIKMEEVIVTSP
jgi:hypothetical protein